MVNVTTTTTLNVSDEDIETIIEMAGFGIAYWASAATVDSEARTYTVIEQDADTAHSITYDRLANVIIEIATGQHQVGYTRAYAENYLRELRDPETAEYAGGHIDSDLADVIVQIAALGEVTYS